MIAPPDLRPYQVDSIAAVRARYVAGDRATLLVLPTGCGKTVVFAEIARRTVAAGGRVLILAHRSELLGQAIAKLAAVGVRAELERGDVRASASAPVVVASVQSLHRKRLARFAPTAFALVVIDEAHHATAAGYRLVIDHFAPARVLGVTATPDRADGHGLGDVFASVAHRYELRAAIRDGYLARLVAKRVEVKGLDLSDVKTLGGDLRADQVAAILADEKILHGIAAPLVELAGARRTVVFAVDVATAHALADVINRYRPGQARAIDGTADDDVRAGALADFAAGRYQFLVNCALFTEGFDEPSIACVAMTRPTKSRGLYTQCVGRGTRLFPGKADCLVLDFTGQAGRHRLIGPADCLAGRELLEDERRTAERMLGEGEQLELDQVLDAVANDLAAQRKKANATAIAHYRATELDLFLGDFLHRDTPEDPTPRQAWHGERATEGQLAAIVAAKLGTPPVGFTRGEANAVLDAIAERRKAGLATIPQARLLAKFGLDVRAMTFERAGELIAMWATAGKRPAALFGVPEFRGRSRG